MIEITANADRCADSLTWPGIFDAGDGKLVLIGKKVGMPEILARLGNDESAVEIDAGIVERALAARSEAGAIEKDVAAMVLLDGEAGAGEKQCR